MPGLGGDGKESIVVDVRKKEANPKPLLICKVDFGCQWKGSADAGLLGERDAAEWNMNFAHLRTLVAGTTGRDAHQEVVGLLLCGHFCSIHTSATTQPLLLLSIQ